MDDLIDRLEGLLAKATPGPWYFDRWRAALGVDGRQIVVKSFALSSGEEPEANATLIVEAVNALPTLLAELTRLEALVARQREALEHLATEVPNLVPKTDTRIYHAYLAGCFEGLQKFARAALQETERD